MVALTGFTFSIRNARQFADALAEYWQCEIAGVSPENSCDRESFEQFTSPGLTAVSFILMGIFPAVNLIFAVNIREIKQKFKTWRGQAAIFCPYSTGSTASTMSSFDKK